MTVIAPRWYQEEAVEAVFRWFTEQSGFPAIVLPTGAGKSLVLSMIIERALSNAPIRVVVLATQAELVRQNAKAAALLNGAEKVGIYSAGLGVKDATRPITVANIQSLAKQAYAFDPFDLILVDEAHTIADADSGQYRTFLEAQRKQNPSVVVIGLTATPYKLSSGLLYGQPTSLFAGLAYEAPVLRLIEEGYLTRPITPKASLHINTDGIALRGGEFVPKALTDAVDVDAVTNAACDEMVEKFKDRHHWLAFACSVEHARHIAEALTARGVSTAVVHGELDRDERAYRLAAFNRGDVRALVNCQLLTTGWDEPQVDGIALLRPTKSAGLYAQMIGRGMRVHLSKTDCLILDFARLVESFGPVDAIRVPEKKKGAKKDQGPPAKLCPICETFQATSVRVCIGCGHEFPPPAIELSSTASGAPILSTDAQPVELVEVTNVQYQKHEPKPPKTTPTLRVDYYRGYRRVASEWVCLEHDGFARQKAERWWLDRSPDHPPATVDDAVLIADDLLQPTAIQLQPDPKNPQYTRIVGYRFPVVDQPTDGLPKACWSCQFWLDRCEKWDAVPPSDVQAVGCDDWTDLEPLPF